MKYGKKEWKIERNNKKSQLVNVMASSACDEQKWFN